MKINFKIKEKIFKLRDYLSVKFDFLNGAKEKVFRSIVKSITWRIIGTSSLIAVTYFFTKNFDLSVAIGGIDIISNLILYFVHERVWERISWGRSFFDQLTFTDNKKRSFAKSISWRILATLYLMVVSYILTDKLFVSVAISLTDAILNIIEYYLHERVWNLFKFGR